MIHKRKFLRFMGEKEYQKLMAGEVLVHPSPDHEAFTNSKGFCFFELEGYKDDLNGVRWFYEFTDGIVDDYVAVVFESDGDGLFEGYGRYSDPYGSFSDTIYVDEYSTLSYSRETMVPVRSYMHFDEFDTKPLKVNNLSGEPRCKRK